MDIFTPYNIYRVTSDSMSPIISEGDYVLTTDNYDQINKNDIIVFKFEYESNTNIIHRAKNKTDKGWITKGDANLYHDQKYGARPYVSYKNIKAKYITNLSDYIPI